MFDWELSVICISVGLCIGMVLIYFVKSWFNEGKWVVLELENFFSDSVCCLIW